MTVLFWDIDGTLLTTGRAGIFAWEDACHEVTGHRTEFQTLKTDGLTDHQVARRIIESVGADAADDALIDRLIRSYEAHLPKSLPKRLGRVHPGVKEALEYFKATRADVHSMLLTGNTAAGARAKLTYYGLQQYFEGGAFSQDMGPRGSIACRAVDTVRARFPQDALAVQHMLVIGDTPHDIDCAQAIGVRTLAVATGGYSAADLEAHGAWRVFDQLPAPDVIEMLIDGRAVGFPAR
jgi:phosphoglycolate phosphatase-like HAD superfamily hydrolase